MRHKQDCWLPLEIDMLLNKILALILVVVASAGPTQFDFGGQRTKLKAGADALSKAADECLYDTRDRGLTFERSPNCGSLRPLARTYIDAGGFHEEPLEIKLIAERARTTAWMALATALAGGRVVAIW